MIAEFGLAALWLAAALALLQLVGAFAGVRGTSPELAAVVRPAAVVQAVLTALAFLMLIWVFARTDLSVLLVAENSHSEKPMIFKLAGAWGNHEGSMLMWVAIMALVRRADCADRTPPAGTDAAGDTRCAGLRRARLLCLPAVFLQPLYPARSAGRRRGGPQPAAAGHRARLPPAHALPRLRRAFGGLQLRRRRAADPQRHPRFRPGHAPLGARRMDFPDPGHHRRILLGLLRARLGRLVVLGPGRERQPDAVAGGDSAAPFGQRVGRSRRAADLDRDARRRRLLDEHDRHVPRALGHPHERPRLRRRSGTRHVHPRAAGDLYRRRAGAVRRAGEYHRRG